MKCVFFLNGGRGIFVLKKLINNKFIEVSHIICCNKKIKKEIKQLNKFKSITYFLKNINSDKSKKFLKKINADLFIIGGYPQIFKKEVINIPNIMTINLHGGPLPKYRGGSPLNWQIINQEKKIGVSIIKVDEGIDTGPILLQGDFNLKKNQTIKDAHKKANIIFCHLLNLVLKKIKKKNLKIIPQKNNKKLKYWKQRSDLDGYIDFKKTSCEKVDYFIRAITKPYPGAWSKLKVKNKIKKIRFYVARVIKEKLDIKPGKYIMKSNKLYIQCKDKALLITNYKFF